MSPFDSQSFFGAGFGFGLLMSSIHYDIFHRQIQKGDVCPMSYAHYNERKT